LLASWRGSRAAVPYLKIGLLTSVVNPWLGVRCGAMKLSWRQAVPWGLVTLRILLAPFMVLVASRLPHPQLCLGAMLLTGFLSDVYDGILARRWGTETAALRVSDSAADTVFYLGVAAALVVRHWPIVRGRLWLFAILLALEALRLAFDSWKYRRMASYHSYLAKVWGVILVVATVAALCLDRAYWLLTLAIAWGILCDLEGLAMSCLLPLWAHDVKTLAQAFRLRRQQLQAQPTPNTIR